MYWQWLCMPLTSTVHMVAMFLYVWNNVTVNIRAAEPEHAARYHHGGCKFTFTCEVQVDHSSATFSVIIITVISHCLNQRNNNLGLENVIRPVGSKANRQQVERPVLVLSQNKDCWTLEHFNVKIQWVQWAGRKTAFLLWAGKSKLFKVRCSNSQDRNVKLRENQSKLSKMKCRNSDAFAVQICSPQTTNQRKWTACIVTFAHSDMMTVLLNESWRLSAMISSESWKKRINCVISIEWSVSVCTDCQSHCDLLCFCSTMSVNVWAPPLAGVTAGVNHRT